MSERFSSKGIRNQTDGYIHRLEVDLALDKDTDANDDRQLADSCYDLYIGPAVEDVIDRYSQKYHLDIESIEIDLGKISRDDLPMVLRARLEDELDKRLNLAESKVVHNPEEEEISFDFDFTGNRAKGLSPFDAIVSFQTETAGRQRSSFPDIREAAPAITEYLLEEAVPWMVPADEFHPEDIVKDYLEELLEDDSFVRAVFSGRDAFIRFIDLLDEEGHEIFQSRIRNFLDAGLVDSAVLNRLKTESTTVLPHPYDTQNSAFEEIRVDTSPELEQATTSSSIVKESERELAELIKNAHDCLMEGRLPDLFCNAGGQDDIKAESRESRESRESEEFKEPKEPEESVGNTLPARDIPRTEEKLSTGAAGLVILHPFLSGFFQNLGLTDSRNEFINDQARIEAAHILHHIAYPESKNHSHELVLEKLLCGLPLNAAIPVKWNPNDRTEEEISQLCSAVCSYWKPLKNTSREGLRTSFIVRDGLLGREDGTWVLHVESQAIDILMDELPWEISTILLSWSEDILMVDWQTQ